MFRAYQGSQLSLGCAGCNNPELPSTRGSLYTRVYAHSRLSVSNDYDPYAPFLSCKDRFRDKSAVARHVCLLLVVAFVGDVPDAAAAVVGDEEAAVLADCDTDWPTPN